MLVEALGEVLGFRPEFFYEPAPSVFDPQEVNFRHRASTPEGLKACIAAKASLFRMIADRLDDLLAFPALDVPQVSASTSQELEDAARLCRDHWGLGQDTPIQNVIRVAENAGVVVAESEEADRVDAFSAVQSGLGVIMLNTSKASTSRRRFNVAHEIGHLVAHRGLVTGTKDREEEADLFAAAFLLPATGFTREFRAMEQVNWPSLFELKRRWKTSVAAIIRRAYQLELISALEYRRLYKSLSARGWRKKEPHEPPYEEPELMKIAVTALEHELQMSLLDVGRELGWSREKTAEVTGFRVPEPLPENVRSISRFRAERN